MSEETIQKTFTVPAGSLARLEVSNIRGSVEVLPGEAGVIDITAVKESSSGDLDQTEVLLSQAEDGSVKAEVKNKEGWGFWSSRKPCKVNFTIRVPSQCAVKAKGVSNSLNVHQLEGNFDFSSVSGEISLNELSGPLKLDTVSGDVAADAIRSNLEYHTVSGDLHMINSQVPAITGNTVSGDLSLQTALADGPYAIHSVSGNVRLVVPAETHCTAEVHSISGRVHTSFPQTSSRRSNGKQVVEVQGGGVNIRLNSVSGDLWIGTAEGEAPAAAPAAAPTAVPAAAADPAAAAPVPPSQPAKPSRKEILDRIERGEISVEEGLKLLS